MTNRINATIPAQLLDDDFDAHGQTDYVPPSCGHYDDDPAWLAGVRGYWSRTSNPYKGGSREAWLWDMGYQHAADAD